MLADEIREFVYEFYIVPARKQGAARVTVRAGDIHKRMGLSGRMPAVCGAIETQKFQEKYDVRLVERKGPKQGANVYFIFEV
jgi:hypothetical protein